jgi:hypothetical protein
MANIWSIARHTFAQCVRMKVAAAFMVLLVVALVVLPAVMTGDDTLAGQIRAFLAYSTGVTGVLLSLLTIFVGTSLVSSDVRTHQVFSVATKPLGRWQYIVGRWVGLVGFNVVLLAVSGGAIYATAQYLRGRTTTRLGPVSLIDRRAVESEVFAARRRVAPEPLDLDGMALERMAELRKAGRYQEALAAWMSQSGGDLKGAVELLKKELKKQIAEEFQPVSPNSQIEWDFSGIEARGRRITETATVEKPIDPHGLMTLRIPPALTPRLSLGRPVEVGGLDARVDWLWADATRVRFGAGDAAGGRLRALGKGERVELQVDPVVQITYKVTLADSLPGQQFTGLWRVSNESGFRTPWFALPVAVRRKVVLTASGRAASEEGRLRLTLFNASPARVTILSQNVAVLYEVGGFEGNFARAVLLILCQLVFLAAVSVAAGSMLSFPVACMLCFSLLPFAMARSFLADAVSIRPGVETGAITWVGHYVFGFMRMLLPDFARTTPGELLVDGINISWLFVVHTAALDIALRAAVVLLAACVIFGRRELAKVQM